MKKAQERPDKLAAICKHQLLERVVLLLGEVAHELAQSGDIDGSRIVCSWIAPVHERSMLWRERGTTYR